MKLHNISAGQINITLASSTLIEIAPDTSVAVTLVDEDFKELMDSFTAEELVFEFEGNDSEDFSDWYNELVSRKQEYNISSIQAKVYEAIIKQTGTGAPTVIVGRNDIGNIIWTRDGAGNYTGTLVGAFTAGKRAIEMSVQQNNLSPLNSVGEYSAGFNDEDSIYISTASRDNTTGTTTVEDGWLYDTIIRITVMK